MHLIMRLHIPAKRIPLHLESVNGGESIQLGRGKIDLLKFCMQRSGAAPASAVEMMGNQSANAECCTVCPGLATKIGRLI